MADGNSKTGRHVNAAATQVRLVTGAVEDLERMMRKGDPQVVRWALKKMLLLERDPDAGVPLLGNLVGWRKIVVGDRDWRIVWRVTHDVSGTLILDIAEVWAFGARSDAEVYAEVEGRIAASGAQTTHALSDVLAMLRKVSQGLSADASLSKAEEPVPQWLIDSLVRVVGMPADEVDSFTLEQANKAWLDFTTGGSL